VRRTIAGLRDAGIVTASKGPGGGIRLGRPPEEISIAAVSAALGEPLLKLGADVETPTCLIEQSVVARLDAFREEAERLLAARLSTMTVADIIADVGVRFADHHRKKKHGS
jgi:DNA-binding IscR family transcriptional regulator